MEFSPRFRRNRKPPPPKNSDLYSTVVIHDKDDAASGEPEPGPGSSDIYSTMVYKDDAVEDEEESLPPLLKRLPKDFGGGGDDISDSDDDSPASGSISGTVIVKPDRRRSNYAERNVHVPSPYAKPRSTAAPPFWERRSPKSKTGNEEESAGDFSTFVVRDREDEEGKEEEDEDEGMGTMVRRGGGSGGGGTMRRAVESMQKAGEVGGMGYGRRRKSSGGGEGIAQLRQQGSGKVSSSSIPEYVTREDPSTKYELLHELGKDSSFELALDLA